MNPLKAFALLFLLLTTTSVVRAALPPPDFNDLAGYRRALQASTDPDAKQLLQQIADGPADLARERAQAQKEGLPLDSAQLQRPLPPADQNAAPLYQQIGQILKDKPLNLPRYADPMTAAYSYTPEQIAAVEKILASRQDVLTLVHQAADRPQCVFQRDWKEGPALLFPEYAPMRASVRLLQTESFLIARQGRYSDAVANQARGFRIAEHAASDPILIAYFVGVACDALTLSGMKGILTLAGPNAAVDAQVQQAIATHRPRLSLRDALGGEMVVSQVGLHQMRAADPQQATEAFTEMLTMNDAGAVAPTRHAPAAPLTAPDRLFVANLLDAIEAQQIAALRPFIAAGNSVTAYRAAAAQEKPQPPGSPIGLYTSVLLPVYDKLSVNAGRIQAQEQIAMAGAALLSAKAKTGAFPDTLPTTFTDPFNSKPLAYRREGDNGFVVYSIGPDGNFDGGKPGEKIPAREAGFRFPAAVPTPAT